MSIVELLIQFLLLCYFMPAVVAQRTPSQRTLKSFPLEAHGIRFVPIENDNRVPYDLVMILALHGIWKYRMAMRHREVAVKWSREYFGDSMRMVIEVWRAQPEPPGWLTLMETLTNLKQC